MMYHVQLQNMYVYEWSKNKKKIPTRKLLESNPDKNVLGKNGNVQQHVYPSTVRALKNVICVIRNSDRKKPPLDQKTPWVISALSATILPPFKSSQKLLFFLQIKPGKILHERQDI